MKPDISVKSAICKFRRKSGRSAATTDPAKSQLEFEFQTLLQRRQQASSSAEREQLQYEMEMLKPKLENFKREYAYLQEQLSSFNQQVSVHQNSVQSHQRNIQQAQQRFPHASFIRVFLWEIRSRFTSLMPKMICA